MQSQPANRASGGVERQVLARAGAAVFEFDGAGGEAARAEDQLLGQADQIHRGEFGAGRLVAVVVQHLDPGVAQLAVEVVGGGGGIWRRRRAD